MLHLSVGGAAYISTEDDNGPLTELDFPTQKARALFVYLGLTQGRRHSRHALSALFWPDADEKSAANNLRQTIHRVRSILFDAGVDPAVIDTSAQHVMLIASTDVVIDTLHIDQVWRECLAHTHRSPDQCTVCAGRLARAAKRINAAPLAGLALPDSAEFELWLASRRTQIVDSSRQILQTLARFHVTGGETATALHYVRQWLALEPWQEEAHALAMELLAAQGMRTAALHQFQQCRQVLQDELGVEPDADLQRLHDRIAAGGILPLPAPRLHHAPFVATALFGRQTEWHTLEALLNDPANRLITLLGMGGVGKTQLALAAGHALARLFPDGAWYVSLETVSGELQFQSELARALGIALGDGQPLDNQILQFLSRRNLLILLDGFEHLIQTASFLARLLQRCPRLTLLVTSRARLDLHAEHVLPLDGLPVPETLAQRSPNADDSLTHFVHAAQRLTPAFALTPDNSSAVLEICRLLGGLPLAVELTAAQSATHSCQYLARELRHNLDLAAANWLDVSPRQRSLRASFDASWRHLSPYLQRVLSSLTVCEGTFTADAALAIVKATVDDGGTHDGIEASMHLLVDTSLLRHATNGRYSLHAAVRAFAAERLGEHDPHRPHHVELTRTAHLDYFAGWLCARHPSYAGEAQKDFLDQIDQETGNLWAAWRWAETKQDWTTLNRMAPVAHAAWTIRGRHEECARLLDQSIDALHTHQASGAPETDATRALIGETLATLLILRGVTALQLSDRHLAHTHAAEALRWLHHLDGDPLSPLRMVEANYQYLVCKLAMYDSNWPELEIAARQGLAVLSATSNKHLRGLLLGYLGLALQAQGQIQHAIRTAEEGIALLTGSDGDYWNAAGHRTNIASTLLLEGRGNEAARMFQESYTYFHHIGDLVSAAICLDHLASVELLMNHEPQAAARLCRQALTLLEQTGLPSHKAEILSTLGVIALNENDARAARVHMIAALRIAMEINRTVDIIIIGAWLSISLLRLGHIVAPAVQFLCAALNSPLLHAEMHKLLKEAVDGLLEPCSTPWNASEAGAQYDWQRAATALLAPLPDDVR